MQALSDGPQNLCFHARPVANDLVVAEAQHGVSMQSQHPVVGDVVLSLARVPMVGEPVDLKHEHLAHQPVHAVAEEGHLLTDDHADPRHPMHHQCFETRIREDPRGFRQSSSTISSPGDPCELLPSDEPAVHRRFPYGEGLLEGAACRDTGQDILDRIEK